MPDPHWKLGRIYITDETGKSVGPALQHSDASWLTGAYRLSKLTLRFSQIAVMMMPIRQCITLSKQILDLQYVRCPSMPATCGTTSGVQKKKTLCWWCRRKNPCSTTPPTLSFFPWKLSLRESSIDPAEWSWNGLRRGEASFVKRLCCCTSPSRLRSRRR